MPFSKIIEQKVTGSTQRDYNEEFMNSKLRISCQTYLPENNKKMFLSDLQTVGFWSLKNERSIAAIEPSEKTSSALCLLSSERLGAKS